MRTRTTACIGIGVSTLLVILTIALDISPYFVIGVISFCLGALLFVDGARECLRRPFYSQHIPPPNWKALEQEELPKPSTEDCQRSKQRLAEGCAIGGGLVPRIGVLALAEHPLGMDE